MSLFKLSQINIDNLIKPLMALQESGEIFSEQLNNLHEALSVTFKPLFDELAKFPDNTLQLLPYLLERGWYLSYESPLPMVNKCCDLMKKGEHNEIEDIMCKFARSRIDNTKKELISFWPHRSSILNDAFEALSNGKYTLSIPVMIAQADGIACEIFRSIEQFFSGSAIAIGNIKNSKTYQLIIGNEQLNLIIFFIEASVFNKNIIASKGERDKLRQNNAMLNIYNRHEIIHGESIAYATEGNALRSVMLLDFLISINVEKEESERREKESGALNKEIAIVENSMKS